MPAESTKVVCPVCHGSKNPDRALCGRCNVKSCPNGHLMGQDSNVCRQCGWEEPLKKRAEPTSIDTGDNSETGNIDTIRHTICPRCKLQIESTEGRCPYCGYLRLL